MAKLCSIGGCGRATEAKGFCHSHYTLAVYHGMPTKTLTPRGVALAWLIDALSEPLPDTCIEWPYSRYANGYGAVYHLGLKLKAHRLALELHSGRAISSEEYVLHSCDNRSCFNPLHLRVGTAQDNVDDMMRRGRVSRVSRNAKLTAAQVLAAYRDPRSAKIVAEELGVSRALIYGIRNGTCRADITAHLRSG